MGVEALLTFFLVTTVLHTAVAGKAGPLAGWAIGTALAIAILAGGPLTGGSLNPARTFGPAAVAGTARDGMMYLIYFLGPLLGSAIAVGAYRLLEYSLNRVPIWSRFRTWMKHQLTKRMKRSRKLRGKRSKEGCPIRN